MRLINYNLSWDRNRYSLFARQWDITITILQFSWLLLLDFISKNNRDLQKKKRARWLVKKLIKLGPTFIKIGQALSTRPDLIPLEYVEEFSQLQDRVPPFLSEDAIALIELELGDNIENIFAEFERVPIAAASLGQVHRAKLKTGEKVVVKVQRRGLEQLFQLDFKVLKILIGIGNRFIPSFKKYDLNLIYQEFFEILFAEINYLQEGENADRFRFNFQKEPKIIVPKVYWEYTTKKILTLEYLPGIKINDKEALLEKEIPIKPLIELGICTYLKQLLEDGFFQSDPHPGNMAVNDEGAIIFYDFGAMAEVKGLAKEQMVQTFFAMLQKDTDQVLNTLIYMGLIEPVGDMTAVKRLISFSLTRFLDKPIDVNAFKEISAEIYVMFEQQPFRLPPQLTFIIKALTTLDGIARTLDSNYSLLAASQPFVRNLTRSSNPTNILLLIAREGKNIIQKQLLKPSRLETAFSQFQQRLEQGELQLRSRSLEAERINKSIYLAIKALIYACLSGFSLLGGILLVSTLYHIWAFILFGLTGLFSLFLVRSLFRLIVAEKLLK
ncbi:AarF/ABC1/UbiB kinase family protein [Cyanobacterium aponinum UTEX 3222]|uniref:AarF/ABC1/UbiB kinase family protein n=1 Tax=Cyanobacterium aponinum 0216 TaxID=2676140 RepID=A0A844GMA4_9CHRO|nr:AarF/ABC1/UbiB kinase family protein [Cyanobacterium aponinum]MTF37714.1 AarF/ABC1/UbiB kinase family protein [Cyanobacterium aponinum 0216]WRL38757.1 AarF/ABC1/UbiB kinase family protein [Cyanobacterium aponinum UTEX 3221]WRL40952.1 AarF/ABC1/UbiB kinase family protein [Cyanobacterium aponinum UTEX 3222]